MNYEKNRVRARTFNNQPTMTDQSQAADTDLNIIVRRFGVTGQIPRGGEPMYGDFSELPTDLRGMIEKSKEVESLRRKLPKELAELDITELLTLTPEQLSAKLTKPTTTGDKPSESQTGTTASS